VVVTKTKELIICRGIPASGKSTWAEKWVAKDPENRRRVNRDNIRFEIYGTYRANHIDERLITEVENNLIESGLRFGMSVAVDATNLDRKNLRRFYDFAEKFECPVRIKDFEVTLGEALKRDSLRDKSVGEEVIKYFFVRYTNGGVLPVIRTNHEV
jgi:predicted kinase